MDPVTGSPEVTSDRTNEPEPAGLLLTVEEAARRLRIGRTLVYRLISSGDLESVKVGRLRRVPVECLPEYVATLRDPGHENRPKGSSAA